MLAHAAYPGVVDVLEILQSKAKLAVLTNKPLAATRTVRRGLGSPDAFLAWPLSSAATARSPGSRTRRACDT